jgi:hypothetical protein
MKLLRSSARWLLLVLLLPLIPASQAHAGVFISVGFAPPVLPVYVQPVCPTPGLMWTPGYWAYGPDGYYWVPGAWVPAPYVGALWTPPYWGYEGSVYMFHAGYWGPHVGYYGGINYGFGYGGIGFAGGAWRGGIFAYNTAVMRVGSGGGWGNRVYVDRAVVDRGFVARDSRVAFNGGPNGVRYQASAQERSYMSERHVQATSFQTQHEQAARSDRMAYAKANGGRPQNLAASRPLQGENRGGPGGPGARPGNEARPVGPGNPGARPGMQNGGARPEGPATRPGNEARPAYNQPNTRPAPETRPSQPAMRPAQPQERPATRPSQPETRPAPAYRPAPQTRPAPQPRPQQQHSQPKEPKGR